MDWGGDRVGMHERSLSETGNAKQFAYQYNFMHYCYVFLQSLSTLQKIFQSKVKSLISTGYSTLWNMIMCQHYWNEMSFGDSMIQQQSGQIHWTRDRQS